VAFIIYEYILQVKPIAVTQSIDMWVWWRI